MVFWKEAGTTDGQGRAHVAKLLIAHKEPACSGTDEDGSEELWWYSGTKAAMSRLASLVHTYAFTAEQMVRLVQIAWAVSKIATPQRAAEADEFDAKGI
jgi:hypothetical protein